MRIKINFKPSTVEIPAKEIINLTKSYLHRIIGNNNDYHGKPSNYAITPLMRGKYNKDNKSYSFPYGTYIVFSSIDEELMNIVFSNIYKVNVDNNLQFFGIDIIEETFTNGNNYITTLSPILIRDVDTVNKKTKELTYLNKYHFENTLTEKTINKLNHIDKNLNTNDFTIKLTYDNSYNKINIIPVNNIPNKTSQCNLLINTNKKVMETLYNIGLGMSTGCGFGTFYNTINYKYYNIK